MNEIFVVLTRDRLKGNIKRIFLADKEVSFVFTWKFKVIFSFNFDTFVCICSGSEVHIHNILMCLLQDIKDTIIGLRRFSSKFANKDQPRKLVSTRKASPLIDLKTLPGKCMQ